MSQAYLSEIRIMAFAYAPRGWALCNGQILPINQNQALFSLIGTFYGGNGQTTFMLPNLQGMAPVHMGDGFSLGQTAGEVTHTLTLSEMPQHNHLINAKDAQADLSETGATPGPTVVLAQAAAAAIPPAPSPPVNVYGTGPIDNAQTFAPGAIANTGGNQPHQNQQPYLVLNFCICLSGIYPSRN
jgi:microcystin-dependent protein